MVLTKIMDASKVRVIQERIETQLDLWERGFHEGLVGDALAGDRSQEGCFRRLVEEEDDRLACSFHSTVMLGKL